MNCFKVHLQVPCNFEFSITCIALKLLCPFMNGGFMSYHLSILQTASATKIPPQILQIHVLLMASVAAQLILAIFIATSFCLFFDYLELKITSQFTIANVERRFHVGMQDWPSNQIKQTADSSRIIQA